MSGHRIVNPPSLAPPTGFAHAVVAATPGRTVYLGGQTAQRPDGSIAGTSIPEQFGFAAGNMITALAAAGGRAEHLVSLLIYVTDMPAYRAALPALAPVYREHFGRHYPAIALLGVHELFDPAALVELVGTAVIPTNAARPPGSPSLADPRSPTDTQWLADSGRPADTPLPSETAPPPHTSRPRDAP